MNLHEELPPASPSANSRRATILLWVVAVVIMLATATYQRRTGPTHPLRGSCTLAGEEVRFSLIRSDWSREVQDSARVLLPRPGGAAAPDPKATLHYRRYLVDEPFTEVAMRLDPTEGNDTLFGELPAQPAAGKLEYFITVDEGAQRTWIPGADGETVVIRFKDHVPIWILLPHVLLMFFAILFGLRAGLGAVFAPAGIRRPVWIALGGMTLGGMVLGPIVQKHAFGAYWTGFPWGGDWTDNKMLVMWLVWVATAGILLLRPRLSVAATRSLVLVASLAMMAVYLIPHSIHGSQLDYSQVDQGVPPAEAIETGR